MNKKQYRINEFNKIKTIYSEYKTAIKFVKPNGETNFLSIDNKELKKIIELLTNSKVKSNSFGEFEIKSQL